MADRLVHDFNNILTPILGAAEFLGARSNALRDQPEQLAALSQSIHAAANRVFQVLRSLSLFAGTMDTAGLVPVTLNELVEQVVSGMRQKWHDRMGSNRAIEISTSYDDIPPVLADDSLLRQVITNILTNCEEAMPAGGAVKISTRGDATGVRVVISDTGAGMPPELRRRCLEPFATNKKRPGAGMGLAVAYGIIRQFAGTIDVKSQLGRGTKVVVTLPPARPANPQPGVERSPSR